MMRSLRLRPFACLLAIALLGGCAAGIKRGDPANDARAGATATAIRIPAASSKKLVLVVDGPPSQTGSSDWEGFKAEWREAFAEATGAAGIAFEMPPGPAQPTGQDGTLLAVHVSDFRFIRPATRYMVGVMSGNAYIESKLSYSDLRTGAPFGTELANTSSSAWQGVFSAMTNRQVAAIAADVVQRMTGAPAAR